MPLATDPTPCPCCRRVTSAAFLQRMARSFQQPIEACLECVRSRKDRAELGVALFHAFSIPLAFLFFRMPVGDRGIGSLLPTLYAAFAAYAWTAVPIHELGHALAAMLTGSRLSSSVAAPPRLLRQRT